jgi:hypothetical protein
MKKSFSYRGAIARNNLPDDNTKPNEQLSNGCLKTLLDKNFYELNDVV